MKRDYKKKLIMGGNGGFSLIELMVAIAIVGIVLVSLSAVFERSGRLYTTQNVSAALQEEVRAAVEIIAREARMAGFDPLKTGDFELKTATSTHLRFTTDLNEDGAVATTGFPNCERLSFRYSAAQQALQIVCNEGGAGQDIQVLIGNSDTLVTAVDFAYRDNDGNPTTFVNQMRSMVITLTAEAPAGRTGMIERSYTTWVDFRNMASNAAYN
ncbi:PilW family protein [Desulfofustis glycolicus]|uniref:Prepilin-type N-terminal cleavage/methylation domain-containing protein n=1 Tax=Desulfofustis glycolicus DSM 9705 TaxID=1121409 RepID=A0A1M5X8H1_9BACT|nr:prepilin-type N-terminal cleavage/methylation domain-containing protein [Desulfofustis glycolicus]SHH95942.1 prepilin-type N-terminal cleavage/methylation domain-containing protein [Desulfofustis glycolicus DSM 9705]